MLANLKKNHSTKVTRILTGSFLAASVVMTPTAGFAAGGGDSNTGAVKKKLKCKKGYALNKSKKKCVKVKKSSYLDQESVFEYGRNLAYAGRFQEAIDLLRLAPNRRDHRVLNMLGYSFRKSGSVSRAFGYYYTSIAINPDYSLVRQYLGEAYVNSGNLERARMELAEIERICGSRKCNEYGQLAELITKAQS